MSSILPIANILQIADIGQYLAANDISQGKKLKSGFLAPALSLQIFNAKTVVRWMYNLNPSDSTLTKTGNYLFQLLGGYVAQAQAILNNVAGGLATISNPADVNINVGQNAVFSVTVTSSSPYVISWYRNGVLIPGATGLSYTLTNAQLTDTASTFFAVATNATGPISSGVATLTVTAVIVGFFYQGNTDYSNPLGMGVDNVAYLGTFNITTGQPFTVTFPHLGASEYIVVKYPIAEPTKTHYVNPPPSGLDSGAIPSIALRVTTIGAWKYIYSANGSPFALNNTTGQIEYS